MDLSGLPARTTPDREYYGAIVDILSEQNRMLSELVRLVRISMGDHPGPKPEFTFTMDDPSRLDQFLAARLGRRTRSDDTPTAHEVPVETPHVDPEEETPPVDEPIAIREPVLTPPPASGPGSGRTAWAGYATTAGVTVDHRWNRDRIITACRSAGIPT
jgi:hypothetical protein